MSDLATFTAERNDDVIVGSLSGEVDLSNASELERAIAEAVPNSTRGLVLDLSGSPTSTVPVSGWCSRSPGASSGGARGS